MILFINPAQTIIVNCVSVNTNDKIKYSPKNIDHDWTKIPVWAKHAPLIFHENITWMDKPYLKSTLEALLRESYKIQVIENHDKSTQVLVICINDGIFVNLALDCIKQKIYLLSATKCDKIRLNNNFSNIDLNDHFFYYPVEAGVVIQISPFTDQLELNNFNKNNSTWDIKYIKINQISNEQFKKWNVRIFINNDKNAYFPLFTKPKSTLVAFPVFGGLIEYVNIEKLKYRLNKAGYVEIVKDNQSTLNKSSL